MKKVLSLIVVCFLLCAPINAFAEATYNESPTVSLEMGSSQYDLDPSYDYTVFSFQPAETGKYTFTSSDSLIGIASYTGMWVSPIPGEDTVSGNTFTWECTDIQQSIWVAVKGGAEKADITVTKEELVNNELPWTTYVNKTTPEKFTYSGNTDELLYVDFEDGVVDSAVNGDDGYYHLNTADGPVLYVNINDSLMSLVDKDGLAVPLKAVLYDGDEIIEKIEYNTAFEAYRACAHTVNGYMLYPLTEDLIELYKNVGDSNGWYGADGWVGGEEADAWMFACYYEEIDTSVSDPSDEPSADNSSDDDSADVSDDYDISEPSDGSSDDNSEDTDNTEASSEESSENDSSAEISSDISEEAESNDTTPQTGDSSAMIVFAIFAVIALFGTTAIIRKRG